MFRSLLATSATVALMAGAAHAQTTNNEQTDQGQNDGLQIETIQTQPAQPGQPGMAAGGAGMAGQEIVVNSGDTIVVQPGAGGTFTLNFRLGDAAGGQAGAGAGAGGAAVAPGTVDPQGQPVQRDQLQQTDPQQLSVDRLTGSDVYGVNDDNIGNVSDVLLSEDGAVDAIVVDVGGFLGIGTHPVALGVDDLQFMVDENENWYVFTPFTQEQLEAQPAYDADTYGQNRDQQRLTAN